MPKELILTGRVQGVFCRKYCAENAKKLGLKGSATNLIDGSVSVVIDTDDNKKITDYISALKTNPFGYSFYGRIDDIKTYDYSGSLRGDYIF